MNISPRPLTYPSEVAPLTVLHTESRQSGRVDPEVLWEGHTADDPPGIQQVHRQRQQQK